MTLVALMAGPLTVSVDAFLVFLTTTAITICGGHSVGMHRLLIHRSFRTGEGIEYVLVYLGVLVGMAGPYGMIRLHDIRDWGQRQTTCHAFFAHTSGFWKDAWWQLHCGMDLARAPEFVLEKEIARDRFYRFLERTWMWQQLPWAIALYLLGGWAWVVWGICVRVSISLIGHWCVGYFAHQPRAHLIHIQGACVQGYNLPLLALITFGESYHENHHAYPKSARLGFMPGQLDAGWWVIWFLWKAGVARDICTPENLPSRPGMIIRADGHQKQQKTLSSWLDRKRKRYPLQGH